MYIYTDGSGINGQIGVAAHNSTLNETRHQCLGEEKVFNVFAAERTAMNLTMEMIKATGTLYKIHVIFIDSKSGR